MTLKEFANMVRKARPDERTEQTLLRLEEAEGSQDNRERACSDWERIRVSHLQRSSP